MRRATRLSAIVAVTLVWGAVPAMALTPVKVIGGPGEQRSPSSNGTYLAWTNPVNNRLNADTDCPCLRAGARRDAAGGGTLT